MARCAVWLLFVARTLSIVLAMLSLKAFSYDDDSSFGVHSTTIGQSTVALFALIFGYLALLTAQGISVATGSIIPGPPQWALYAVLVSIDMILALGTYATSCGTIAIVVHARQRHIFVYAITVRYMTHGLLGLAAGALGILAVYTEICLAASIWPMGPPLR